MRDTVEDLTEPYRCANCRGTGDLGHYAFSEDRCPRCGGCGYVVPPAEVARLVNLALDEMEQWADGNRQFNPLHVRNVVMNMRIGPELDYTRVRYALGRNPRAVYLRSKRDLLGTLPIYGFASDTPASTRIDR